MSVEKGQTTKENIGKNLYVYKWKLASFRTTARARLNMGGMDSVAVTGTEM